MVNGLNRLAETIKTERGLQRTLTELRKSSHRVYPDNDKRED
jgi:hypothetical protein